MPEDLNLPTPQPTEPPIPRRRRVTRRSHIPADAEGQAALIASLARRAYPSVELFVFSMVCGAILGLGYLLDSQAIMLFGILVAPLMTPWVGFLLAVLTGSPRFMLETLTALVISLVFVFLGGLLTGFAARLLMPITLNNVYLHSRLWLPALVVFAIGAITLVISFVRSEEKPFLPSVLIAYAFYMPISAAAFGIGSGLPNVWLQGLLVFLAHFALASTLGLLTLFALRLRPSAGGLILSLLTIATLSGGLILLAGSGTPSQTTSTPQNTPTPTALSLLTATVNLPATSEPSATLKATSTQQPPANTTPSPVPLTLEITLPPTETATITLTIPPAPIYGKVQANEGGGANLRDAPGGTYIMTLLNGTIVETYSEFQLVNGVTWVKVFAQVNNGQRIEGWLLESVISYATPEPNFQPSTTPAKSTSTPTITVTP